MARPRVNFNCEVDGCGKSAYAKGYCSSHYHRLIKYGDATVPLKHTGKHSLLGRVFGRLTVIEEAPSDSHSQWLCRCLCGKQVTVPGGRLVNGNTTSCGCARIRHGHAVRESRSPTYQVWQAMKDRCLNQANSHYKDYGGRGIKVCERWLAFENFLADMGEVPSGLSIDRRNNNGNYEPGNCYWATLVEQMNNQRKTLMVEYQGKRQSLGNWARERGMARRTLDSRIRRGWSVDRALNEPVR